MKIHLQKALPPTKTTKIVPSPFDFHHPPPPRHHLGFHNRELIGCGVMNIDDESGENYQILDNERRG
jgi:hypothetical protein